jgi:hypothetical protein
MTTELVRSSDAVGPMGCVIQTWKGGALDACDEPDVCGV